MAVSLSDIIEGAKFRADLTNSDRVSDTEWAALVTEAIQHAWRLAHGARPDFQLSSQDFTVSSGQSASFTAPSTMFGLIDVVANPDTANEFSLGPFAWQNRRAPGGWGPPVFQAQGAQRARLMGNSIYLEPAASAGGIYRCWFCPKPTAVVRPDFTVRLVLTEIFPGGYAAAGTGPTHTLTGLVNNDPLIADGKTVLLGDRVLAKSPTGSNDSGVYTLTQLAGPAVKWVLTRASDADESSELVPGKTFMATEGDTRANLIWQVTSSGVIDVDNISIGSTTLTQTIDAILDQFAELLKVKAALPAVLRDDDLDPRKLQEDLQRLELEMVNYFRLQRGNNGPAKTIDTDARGPAYWMSW